MKEKLFFGLLILLMIVHIHGQESKMRFSNNRIETDFIERTEILNEVLSRTKSNQNLNLLLKKKDTILSTYVLNSFKDSVQITLQDYSIYTILEAKNDKGEWKPIEYWISSDCGVSYHSIGLKSGEILKANTLLKEVGFKTQIRMKFLHEDILYYSNEISASISKDMFLMPNDMQKTVWPLPMSRVNIPKELIYKVVFLEPKGTEDFFKFYEKHQTKQTKN